MSVSENALNQAKDLIESLVLMQEQVSNQAHAIEQLKTQLKEADASLNALQGDNERYKNINNELMTFLQEEIRKNERLKIGLSQFQNVMEQANKIAPVLPEVGGLKLLPPVDKTEVTENTATQPPFYGVHIEKGETIIYPPQECQTHHQLHVFYRLAGISPPDKMLERRSGVLLRGLSYKSKRRLAERYKLEFLPEKLPVKDLAPHYINSGQSATHGPMKREDGW